MFAGELKKSIVHVYLLLGLDLDAPRIIFRSRWD